MAQPHLEVFASEYHMLQFFGKYLPALDVQASGRAAPFLYVYNGDFVLSRNLRQFLTHMEELTALGININASTQKGKAFLIFFDKALKDHEKFAEKAANATSPLVEAATIRAPKVEVAEMTGLVSLTPEDGEVPPSSAGVALTVPGEGFSSVIVTEVNASDVEVVEKVLTEEQQAIMDHAETLRDDTKKAAAKAALEAYALEKGISLSKGKTFDGMLEDLKAAL